MKIVPVSPPHCDIAVQVSSVTSFVTAKLLNGYQDIYIIGGSPANPVGVYKLQVNLAPCSPDDADLHLRSIKSSLTELPPPGYISNPKRVKFPTRLFHSENNAQLDSSAALAHGVYYAPCNEKFCGGNDDLPPLLVKIHG